MFPFTPARMLFDVALPRYKNIAENDMVSDRCARSPPRPVGLLIVFVHVFMLAVTVVPVRMLSASVVRLSQMSIPAL